ncbi:hypothetical protein chiPu_0015448 [Chiloscyllium punctatum]|uniref:Uncharacterized protein n=1 Tax=Chiloscyllium punctatum TaxID=137246 RepID=A0A401T2U7_CHIPU|nr:hypothetical protein [Chiloscyllium punctatum]
MCPRLQGSSNWENLTQMTVSNDPWLPLTVSADKMALNSGRQLLPGILGDNHSGQHAREDTPSIRTDRRTLSKYSLRILSLKMCFNNSRHSTITELDRKGKGPTKVDIRTDVGSPGVLDSTGSFRSGHLLYFRHVRLTAGAPIRTLPSLPAFVGSLGGVFVMSGSGKVGSGARTVAGS